MLGGFGGLMPQVGLKASAAMQALDAVAYGPVVTVTELQRAVARDPGRWLGQTVQVRGRLVDVLVRMCPGDPVCVGQPTLVDTVPADAAERLPLQWGGTDPLRTTLHRLPLLGRLIPPAQEP
jgi:hypothetical protein